MRGTPTRNNPYGDGKVVDACSIFGVIDVTGRPFSGDRAIAAIACMHERGNGLGGGFAVYGCYPDFADWYALHVMYMEYDVREHVEGYIGSHFQLHLAEPIPTRHVHTISDPPQLWRYFVSTADHPLAGEAPDDYVVQQIMRINTRFRNAFVFSSGKNMGVFKGVGYPEELAEFYCLDEYRGYIWTAHGRFPTNTPGWWGGAHPFSILDWTVVHNGEISSYGTNRRYLESFGYHCTMETDTEVVAYAIDLLVRRHKLPIEAAASVLSAPLWSHIDRDSSPRGILLRTLRQVYPSLLLNGPFTVIIAHTGEMIGLTDRIRLRPLTAARHGPLLYLSSEESAIRLVDPDLGEVWTPLGGEPIMARVLAPGEGLPGPQAAARPFGGGTR
ncbi:MAG: glutamine amidotransferase family protein [Anaerolineae bacterium]|nr:glutamine amidotransferase family protein [Anaerolineae bacterium]